MQEGADVDDQVDRIRRNWAKAAAGGDAVGQMFYAKLFAAAPQVRALFPEAMDGQARKLMQTLNWIIDHLDAPEDLTAAAEALARRHVDYGVRAEHYDAVGAALIATLRDGLGAGFEAEDEAAWRAAYGQLSGIMTEAAYADSAGLSQ